MSSGFGRGGVSGILGEGTFVGVGIEGTAGGSGEGAFVGFGGAGIEGIEGGCGIAGLLGIACGLGIISAGCVGVGTCGSTAGAEATISPFVAPTITRSSFCSSP